MRSGAVTLAVGTAMMMSWLNSGEAAGTWPTPEIREIVALEAGGGVAHAMRGELGDTGTYVGLALTCAEGGDGETVAGAFFGGFPADRRPVQLAVRSVEGGVERFGPAVSGGPESGFHSPQMVDPAEAGRFAEAALRAGALVSNGYRSFWNRAGKARNREVGAERRDALGMACRVRTGKRQRERQRRPRVSIGIQH